MEISVSVSRPPGDLFEEELRFLEQVSVRYIDVYPSAVHGFHGEHEDLPWV